MTAREPDLVAAGAAWSAAAQMNPFETVMWRSEADPRLRSTVTLVEIMDQAPDADRLLRAHDWASRIVPRFRQRVVEPPLTLGAPEWVTDGEIDFAYHLQHMHLTAPGTLDQVFEIAQAVAMRPFDRARPLWEAVVIDGLEGGQAAYILKTHHVLTDGIGGVQLLSMLHSRSRAPTRDRPEPPAPPADTRTTVEILAGQGARWAAEAPAEAIRQSTVAAEFAAQAISSPARALTDVLSFASSLRRVADPPTGEPSPLLRPRSLAWRFEAAEVPLADLKDAAKSAGGSVNDAFVAAVLGGFRRYHEHFGVPIDTMPIAMPISLRTAEDPAGGNRFAGARFAAPVAERDPAERMRQVREFVITARAEPAIDAAALLSPALSHLPAALVGRALATLTSTNDAQVSNVPGIPYPVYMAGARITRMYPFGPLPGCAAMITLLSHDGTCCIGINMDAAAITEPGLFRRYLAESIDEILALRPPKPAPAKPAGTKPARAAAKSAGTKATRAKPAATKPAKATRAKPAATKPAKAARATAIPAKATATPVTAAAAKDTATPAKAATKSARAANKAVKATTKPDAAPAASPPARGTPKTGSARKSRRAAGPPDPSPSLDPPSPSPGASSSPADS
jgi:diacylglycerol O-acyltransferase